MANVDCTTNLGNQQRVVRVPTQIFNDGQGGSANAPLIARGMPVFFDHNARADQLAATHAHLRGKAQLPNRNAPAGVLAESLADNYRRNPRKGRKPGDFVMPITFQGLDIAASANRTHVAFAPGDPVYVLPDGMLTSNAADGATALGVASVGAPVGSLHVQLYVNSLELPLN